MSVCTALVGIVAANPTEVVKIRLQEDSSNHYKGCMDCYYRLFAKNGYATNFAMII